MKIDRERVSFDHRWAGVVFLVAYAVVVTGALAAVIYFGGRPA